MEWSTDQPFVPQALGEPIKFQRCPAFPLLQSACCNGFQSTRSQGNSFTCQLGAKANHLTESQTLTLTNSLRVELTWDKFDRHALLWSCDQLPTLWLSYKMMLQCVGKDRTMTIRSVVVGTIYCLRPLLLLFVVMWLSCVPCGAVFLPTGCVMALLNSGHSCAHAPASYTHSSSSM